MNTTLTPAQLGIVMRARALADLPIGDQEAIAAHVEASQPDDLTTVYAEAFGYARASVHLLLQVIDELTGVAS